MARYKLILGNMNFTRYFVSSLAMVRAFVTFMETKLTLHGEILGVRAIFLKPSVNMCYKKVVNLVF
jgi:hypothetical protein